MYMYISCWNEHGGAPGLALYDFNTENGSMEFLKMIDTEHSLNCTYLDQERNLLYVCHEVRDLPGAPTGGGGSIFTYRLDPETGDAVFLSATPTYCPNPTYLMMDLEKKYMLVAHHTTNEVVTKLVRGGNGKYTYELVFDDAAIELFSVDPDGMLGEILDAQFHVFRGPTHKLSHAHPHTTVMSPDGSLFAVCDKGDAKIYMYKIDRENHKLVLSNTPFQDIPYSMPRYCAFHPSLPYFFMNHETSIDWSMDICSFKYDVDGNLDLISRVSALPDAWERPEGVHYQQQGFCITPDGKYLYSALMGPNAVSVISVDQSDGKLKLEQFQSVDGDWPRGCTLTPDGKFLIITCLTTGDILSYAVGENGHLSPTGFRGQVDGSSYITFYDPQPETMKQAP